MTELGIQWFVSSKGVRDVAAFALGVPLDWAEFLAALDLIRSAVFPGFFLQGVFVVIVGEGRGR